MKSIVLAEKPSVARDLAQVLKCHKKHKSFIEGNDYIVTWALGHLVTLAPPEDYDKKLREWRMEDLPMLPKKMKLQVIKKTSYQFRAICQLARRNDVNECIIATDAGREGELVARWILQLAGWKKGIKRLWISSQTDAAIRDGFANLRAGNAYDNLFRAALCRAEADWVVGLNVTRALTCKFNAQLNAGRVQTPTLAMMVGREQEIKKFTPVDYWTIRADFGEYFGHWRDNKGNARIFNYERACEISSKVQQQNGTIVQVTTKKKSEPAPLAYDLTELQRDANRSFGFSAKKTLSVLQDLYERHKIVTYPRTDSRYITHDMVATLPQRLQAMAVHPYEKFAQFLLQKPLSPGKRFVNDSKVSDHHAIIPTEQPLDLQRLDGDERKLYDLIARRFLAVLYPPYRYDQTTIVTDVNGEKFHARGKIPRDLGWREVTQRVSSEESDEDELPDQTLQQQEKGATKPVQRCHLDKGQTKPPARYTEATLLSAMESPGKFIADEELRESIKQGGLGTPATRADIIEKLLFNNYIERRGNSLHPTGKGIQLVDLVPPSLKSPELTAKWEQRLSDIAQGKERREKFMADIRKNAQELINFVAEDTRTFEITNLTKHKCPMCGEFMTSVNAKKGKTLVCPDRACGHRQPEKLEDLFSGRKKSRREVVQNKKMIEKYSDNSGIGTSLGALLKDALGKKSDDKSEQ